MAKVFSTEDGQLNRSVRVVKERQYSDFDLTFASNTIGDNDIYKKTDAAAVKQSIKNLLLTNRNEKPYRPQFGGNLSDLLFSLADGNTGAEISKRIKSSIARYEPRAEVLSLKVSSTPDFNAIYVLLEFRVISTNVVETIDLKISSVVPTAPKTTSVTTKPVDDPVFNISGALYSDTASVISTGDGSILVR